MKTAKEIYEVMKASEEGKEIEIYPNFRLAPFKESDIFPNLCWSSCPNPTWDWESNEYRIKPEKVEPKYRQYESIDEWVNDFDERFPSKRPEYSMPLIWIKDRKTGSVRFMDILTNTINFEFYLTDFVYLDGTPVGKKVEG